MPEEFYGSEPEAPAIVEGALENTIKAWCLFPRKTGLLLLRTPRLPMAQALSGLCEELGL